MERRRLAALEWEQERQAARARRAELERENAELREALHRAQAVVLDQTAEAERLRDENAVLRGRVAGMREIRKVLEGLDGCMRPDCPYPPCRRAREALEGPAA